MTEHHDLDPELRGALGLGAIPKANSGRLHGDRHTANKGCRGIAVETAA